MYERLIQKLINRNVGAIAGTLSPTGGKTYCTVETGSFPNTYDDNTSTKACFKMNQNCLSEWYWDKPVNVTKFRILSQFYYPYSSIVKIWGRVGGSWVEVWSGTWKPKVGVVDSKTISCNNCNGIRISQKHAPSQPLRTCIIDVKVDYEEVVVEGKAEIVSVTKPSSFTPGVSFAIGVVVKNVSIGADMLFVRITNVDTGKVLGEQSIYVNAGATATGLAFIINLVQNTDFYGLVEAGHVE